MDLFERGSEIRRKVLGDAYVDRATSAATELDADFQRWITETAWGGVWARPHLDLRTKSLLTVAILAALGHPELELHLDAALRNGATPSDVAETFFHVAVYAGVPAANSAFKMAKQLYEEAGSV